MKKLILMLVVAFVALAANAQTQITTSQVYNKPAGTAVAKNTVQHNYFYVANFATKLKVQAYLSNATGYGKVKVVLAYSLDNQKWIRADSITVTEATTKATSTLLSPYANYLDIMVIPIDSTQTSSAALNILIEKNQ